MRVYARLRGGDSGRVCGVYLPSGNAMRQKLQQWTGVGAIRKMSELATGKNRSQHIYTFADLRIVIARRVATDVPLMLDNYALICPKCERLAVGSLTSLRCECGSEVNLRDATSLLGLCATS